MRLVHIADPHLGFFQYQRMTPSGVNQRTADVERTFELAIDQTIALEPDVVVLAGDIFHMVRPKNRTVVHAFREFERLRSALPHAAIVMVAGNHDMPRASDMGCVLRLFASLGIRVVDGPTELLDFPALDLAVLAVPENDHPRPELRPTTRRRHNVLLLHGETGGIMNFRGGQGSHAEIPDEELHVAEWDYIALGHYHVYREIAPNEFYAGATDYTSTDIWGELAEQMKRGIPGKGIVERDLVTSAHTFHPLPGTRAHVDLPAISAAGRTTAEVNAAIEMAVASIGGVTDKCVRLVVHDLERSMVADLDHKMIRRLKAEALHFQLDCRKPDIIRYGSGVGISAFSRLLADREGESNDRRSMLQDRVVSGEDVRSLTALGRVDRLTSLGLDAANEIEQPAHIALPEPRLMPTHGRDTARLVLVTRDVEQERAASAMVAGLPDPYTGEFSPDQEARLAQFASHLGLGAPVLARAAS